MEQLLADQTAGDPCRTLKWKHKSLRRAPAHAASAPTLTRLLDDLDYARQSNRKVLALSSPQRHQQFEYLQAQKQAFVAQGWPVIYGDSQKRELIGCFKNAGTTWRRESQRVNVYDFRSLAQGIAIQYGSYAAQCNAGFVYVGNCADTSEFAVDAIQWWWRSAGQRTYPQTAALLIGADGGGSNGHRPRL